MRAKRRKETDGLHEFIRSAGLLKTIRRTGWYTKAGIEDCESVADHTFRTSLLATYFAAASGADSGKAARMALIHDLAESVIGDITPDQKASEDQHRRKERRVLMSMLRRLPSESASGLLIADAKELYEARSKEANIVWQMDKFEMGTQQREYLKQGYDKVRLSEFGKHLNLSKDLQKVIDSYSP